MTSPKPAASLPYTFLGPAGELRPCRRRRGSTTACRLATTSEVWASPHALRRPKRPGRDASDNVEQRRCLRRNGSVIEARTTFMAKPFCPTSVDGSEIVSSKIFQLEETIPPSRDCSSSSTIPFSPVCYHYRKVTANSAWKYDHCAGILSLKPRADQRKSSGFLGCRERSFIGIVEEELSPPGSESFPGGRLKQHNLFNKRLLSSAKLFLHLVRAEIADALKIQHASSRQRMALLRTPG